MTAGCFIFLANLNEVRVGGADAAVSVVDIRLVVCEASPSSSVLHLVDRAHQD